MSRYFVPKQRTHDNTRMAVDLGYPPGWVLASFGWAMRRFFIQPAGSTTGMKMIKAFGIVFGILHRAAIVARPGITAMRGVSGAVVYVRHRAGGLSTLACAGLCRRVLAGLALPRAQGPYRMIRRPLYCSTEEGQKFTRRSLAEAYQQYRARTGLFFANPLKWYSTGKWYPTG